MSHCANKFLEVQVRVCLVLSYAGVMLCALQLTMMSPGPAFRVSISEVTGLGHNPVPTTVTVCGLHCVHHDMRVQKNFENASNLF